MSKQNDSIRAALLSQVFGVGIKVGIAVTLILAVSLTVGLILDEMFQLERRLFTFLLIMLSIPLTLWVLWKISMSAISADPASPNRTQHLEDKTKE